MGREVVTGLGPRAPALDSSLLRGGGVGPSALRDVAKLLSEVVAEIIVAVHRQFARRDVVAGLDAPAVQVTARDPNAVHVLVVHVVNHVAVPARAAEFLGEVEPGFELRLAGRLAAPNAAGYDRAGALQQGQLHLDGQRLAGPEVE